MSDEKVALSRLKAALAKQAKADKLYKRVEKKIDKLQQDLVRQQRYMDVLNEQEGNRGGFPTDEEFKQHHYTIKAIIDEMSAKRKQIHELMRPSLEAEDAMTAEERALIDHLRREGRLSKHRN